MDFIDQLTWIGQISLRYGGKLVILWGLVLWGTSSKSADRGERGYWLMYMGAFMLIVYFGLDVVFGLIWWYMGDV